MTTRADAVWAVGRLTMAPTVKVFARLRSYGSDRVPGSGGVVLALNHFHWIDPAAFGAVCPRTIHYVTKSEAIRIPGFGHFLRSFGAFPVRRGESDREAVREMRRIVADGHALGVFVEGTRQRSGVPGTAQPGAAMVALQEGVPVVAAAVHGSQTWRPGNFHPVSIAWSEPMLLEGLSRGGRGYREGSELIQGKIRELWDWLVAIHESGRPSTATPPP